MKQIVSERKIEISLQTKVLQIGVLAHRGIDQARQMWQPTAKYLSDQLPKYHFQINPLIFERVYAETSANKLDFVITN